MKYQNMSGSKFMVLNQKKNKGKNEQQRECKQKKMKEHKSDNDFSTKNEMKGKNTKFVSALKMNKILENKWFWERYPINGWCWIRKKKHEYHTRM